jgi:hypothetical protein
MRIASIALSPLHWLPGIAPPNRTVYALAPGLRRRGILDHSDQYRWGLQVAARGRRNYHIAGNLTCLQTVAPCDNEARRRQAAAARATGLVIRPFEMGKVNTAENMTATTATTSVTFAP